MLKTVKQVCAISGKGGTGKTSITACLAALGDNVVLADCDVDAANLHLVTGSNVVQTHEFTGSKKAFIRKEACSQCGLCADLCRWEAITPSHTTTPSNDFAIDPLSCEGCALCSRACPNNAIEMVDVIAGYWYVSETRYGYLVHARLNVAQGNSGKLVTIVRKKAAAIATEKSSDLIIIDGPPGIGCPVIASITGVDIALIVTEPSPSGIHDMARVVEVCKAFGVPMAACINRCDLNEVLSESIEEACARWNIPVIGRIPFDKRFAEAAVQGIPAVELSPTEGTRQIRALSNRLTRILLKATCG